MRMPAKRAVLILLCLLAAALATAARALPPPWTPLGPFGGVVSHLTADPLDSGTLYATTDSAIFKTVDGGAHWTTSLLARTTAAVTVDPVHPSTLYVGLPLSPSLLKSTDGGASWLASGLGLPVPSNQVIPGTVTVDPSDPRRLLLAYLGTVWRSTDAGASWQRAASGLPPAPFGVFEVAFAARPAGTAFATTIAGLYRTFDAGLSWKRLDHGLPAASFYPLALAPSDPKTVYVSLAGSGLYRTADGGASWQHVSAPPGVSGPVLLTVSPHSPRTLYAGLDGGGPLFRSTDGGAHWSTLSGVSDVASVAFDADPQRVYAGVFSLPLGGVVRSDDGGASWTRRSQGMTGLATPLFTVDPSDPDRLWTMAGALFRSANAGARWARANSPSRDELGWLAAGASPELFAAVPFAVIPHGGPFYAVWKTADDGASWKQVIDPIWIDVPQILVAPSDPSTIYVAGQGLVGAGGRSEIYRSTDHGETWQLQPDGDLSSLCYVRGIAVAPSAAGVVYLSGGRNNASTSECDPVVLRSADGGATWSPPGTGLPPGPGAVELAVDPRDPDQVYGATTNGGVWRSTDGGRTWVLAGGGLPGRTINQMIATLSGRLYAAVGFTRIFRSDDGGATWQQWIRGLRTATIFSLAADSGDPQRIYAATENGVWVVRDTD